MSLVRLSSLIIAMVMLLVGPLAAEPVKIAFVGDSMADGIWGGAQRRASKDACLRNALRLGRFAEIGTGLARLDKFDWVSRIQAISAQFTPDVIIISMGLNDRTTVVSQSGRDRIELSHPNWQMAYLEQVSSFAKAATRSNATVLWIGIPVLRDEAANRDAKEKNSIFRQAVSTLGQSNIVFIEPWRLTDGDKDQYHPFFSNGDSKVQLRATDGVHFTTAGYDLIVQYLWPHILATLGKARPRDPSQDASCLLTGSPAQ